MGSCPTLVVDALSENVVTGGQLQVPSIRLPYPGVCKLAYTLPFVAAGLDLDTAQVKVLRATGAWEEGILKSLWEGDSMASMLDGVSFTGVCSQ